MCKYVYDIELQKYFLTLGSLKLQVLPWSGNFNILIFNFKIRNVIHLHLLKLPNTTEYINSILC